jgi:hypothetical protein
MMKVGMRHVRGLGVAALAAALAACQPPSARSAPPKPPPASAAAPLPTKPPLLSSADVDARLRAEWQKAGVAPTPAADDATWLRRVWIDVLGTIPPAAETRRFLADPAPDKRAHLVEELLASPSWADHWTSYWDDVWMGRTARGPEVDRGAFRSWLHDAFARNLPWNALVTELLTATGRNSDGGPRRASEENDGNRPPGVGVNGAVNWTLKYAMNPQDMAGAASRTLLGVQIQCAQCHDHKTEKWTQHDFQGFAAAFVRTGFEPVDMGNAMGAVKRVQVRDLDRVAPRFGKMGDLSPIARARPTALDGADLGGGGEVRAALARWVTSPDNPWFARALVNRMWAHFVGRGFVDPLDDLRPSNPPVAPDLLDALAADFARSGCDLKHLVRVIAGAEVYGLSAAPLADATARVDPEAKLWEHFRVAPLGPEELLNALVSATHLDAIVRSTGRLDLGDVRFRVKQRYGFLFDVDEESAETDYEGTIAQGLALLNGNLVATGASDLPGSALAEVLAMPGDAAQDPSRIEALYVRVLSRLPTRAETERVTRFLTDALAPQPDPVPAPPPPAPGAPSKGGKQPKQPKIAKAQPPDPLRGLADRAGNAPASARVRAWEDVLWTLLNSSEFVLNH